MTGNVTFNNAGTSYTIASGGAGTFALILDNAGSTANISVQAGTHTISGPPVVLDDPGVQISMVTGTKLTLSGPISSSNTSGITTAGAGTIVLAASNSYVGGTTINTSTVSISSDNNLGVIPASPATNITLNGGELFANGSFSTSAIEGCRLRHSGRRSRSPPADAFYRRHGVISGERYTSKGGNLGALVLLASNTYTGATVILANGVSPSATAGSSASTGLARAPLLDDGLLILDRSDSFTQSSAITGRWFDDRSGDRTLTLTAAGTFCGD